MNLFPITQNIILKIRKSATYQEKIRSPERTLQKILFSQLMMSLWQIYLAVYPNVYWAGGSGRFYLFIISNYR